MTAFSGQVADRSGSPGLAWWPRLGAAARLLRLELRRSAMLWMMPVVGGLFYYSAFRQSMAQPAMWNLRAMTMQHGALLDFAPPVVGAAAWMGSREGRRQLADLIGTVPAPRWTAQLATWAAVTCWALVAYCCCVGALYVAIARQATWGGPLWWPAIVGAVGVPALSAVGFAVGAWLPSRFTVPIVTVGVFFALGFSAQPRSPQWQVSPTIAGSPYIGPDPGIGTFYHYLPDLSIAQVICLTGVALAALGALGLRGDASSQRMRSIAAGLTAGGLAAVFVSAGLAGTARLDPHGLLAIPALHDAANDRPIQYTPVCDRAAVPICLNPAYAAYLPEVRHALRPMLAEIAGLPGAPASIGQGAPFYQGPLTPGFLQSGTGVLVNKGSSGDGSRRFELVLPGQLPGEPGTGMSIGQFTSQIRQAVATDLIGNLVGQTRDGETQAQQAVVAALAFDAGVARVPRPSLAVGAATSRFAALPAAVRHAWLTAHLAALRAGRITLAELP